ncbi:MAG: regulatory protein RecX [Ruminococcaceae bacterium]|nr:regulatory protein RecX [Oscillospiraceae bacterium]
MNKITITALEPQKKHPERRSVYGDGTFLFGLDEETCVKSGIRTGNTYSTEELEEIRQEAEYSDAKQYAFRLLARKSYSIAMLKRKLSEREYSPDSAEKVIALLCELGYLNDEDYAKRFIHDAVSLRKKGKRLVLQELVLKGIPRELGERLWEEQEIPEDLLTQLIEKKLTDPSDPKCVKRTFDYCIRRGYGYGEVSEAMKEYIENDAE